MPAVKIVHIEFEYLSLSTDPQPTGGVVIFVVNGRRHMVELSPEITCQIAALVLPVVTLAVPS